MFVVCVNIHVKLEHIDDFIAATRLNHEGARREPANLAFDVLQAEDDPTHFFLYEVYYSADGLVAHGQTDHYKTWRDTVADWMAEPRKGARYESLYPTDDQWHTNP